MSLHEQILKSISKFESDYPVICTHTYELINTNKTNILIFSHILSNDVSYTYYVSSNKEVKLINRCNYY